MVQATRLHFGEVSKELKEGIRDEDLWSQAIKLSGGIESLVLAKYYQLRAECIAKE